YPKYATMRPDFAAQMRTYYDFLVRYEEWLIAPDLQDCDADAGPHCHLAGIPLSGQAAAGAVWCTARRKPGYHVIHLINLVDQDDIAWNAPRTPPAPLGELELTIEHLPPTDRVLLLRPDAALGRPIGLAAPRHGDVLHVTLPRLHVWAILVLVEQSGEFSEN